ncbi:hypothetical protein [uncultured Thiodictyon sp.]|uniref:hypothetical protein n=1 Tax=uncultured Thiodictyon sp. TaxID=1846217 RepID=UPI0025F36D57|nr:hypothetical protein [uncultured Thiodictyon sp.]
MNLNSLLGSPRKLAQLRWEVANIQAFLDHFDRPLNGESRTVQLGQTAEFLTVRNFPLPDGYRPDYIDLLVVTDNFPATPPIGLYVLHRNNQALIGQLQRRFNAFADQAFHEAPPIRDYTWICYHYGGNAWRYRADQPARGDNIRKFLASWFAESNQ